MLLAARSTSYYEYYTSTTRIEANLKVSLKFLTQCNKVILKIFISSTKNVNISLVFACTLMYVHMYYMFDSKYFTFVYSCMYICICLHKTRTSYHVYLKVNSKVFACFHAYSTKHIDTHPHMKVLSCKKVRG